MCSRKCWELCFFFSSAATSQQSLNKNNKRRSYFGGSAEPEPSWKVGKPDALEEENLTQCFLSQEGVHSLLQTLLDVFPVPPPAGTRPLQG